MTFPSCRLTSYLLAFMACATAAYAVDSMPYQVLRNGFFPIPGSKMITSVSPDGFYATGYTSDGSGVVRWHGPTALGDGVLTTLGAAASTSGKPLVSYMYDYCFISGTNPTGANGQRVDVAGGLLATPFTPNGISLDASVIGGTLNGTASTATINPSTGKYVVNSALTVGGTVTAMSADGTAYCGYEQALSKAFVYTPSGGLTRMVPPNSNTSDVYSMSADPYGLGYCGEGSFTAGFRGFVSTFNTTTQAMDVRIIDPVRGGDFYTVAWAMSGDFSHPVVVGSSIGSNDGTNATGWVMLDQAVLSADQVLNSRGANIGSYTIMGVRAVSVGVREIMLGGQCKDAAGNVMGFVASISKTNVSAQSDLLLGNYWKGADGFAKGDQLTGYLYIAYWAYYDALARGQTDHQAEVTFDHIYAYALYLYYHSIGQEATGIAQYNIYAAKT